MSIFIIDQENYNLNLITDEVKTLIIDNNITDLGISIEIFKFIMTNTHITKLVYNPGYNEYEDMATILDALKHNKSITTFGTTLYQENRVKLENMLKKNPKITNLELKCGDNTFIHVLGSWKHIITYLDIIVNDHYDHTIIYQFLENNQIIKSLDIRIYERLDTLLSILVNTNIEHLICGGLNCDNDNIMTDLFKMDTLKTIYIDNLLPLQTYAKVMEILKNNQTLTDLTIYCNEEGWQEYMIEMLEFNFTLKGNIQDHQSQKDEIIYSLFKRNKQLTKNRRFRSTKSSIL